MDMRSKDKSRLTNKIWDFINFTMDMISTTRNLRVIDYIPISHSSYYFNSKEITMVQFYLETKLSLFD